MAPKPSEVTSLRREDLVDDTVDESVALGGDDLDDDLDADTEVVTRSVSVPSAPQRAARQPAGRSQRGRLEARKVRRLIRHVDPWSVLKASLLFFLSLWLVFMIAAVIVWAVARGSGTVSKIETFVQSNLSVTDWKLNGDFLFRQFGLVGLILTFASTVAATIATLVFNLISDIIGGVWVTVIEEETSRPRSN